MESILPRRHSFPGKLHVGSVFSAECAVLPPSRTCGMDTRLPDSDVLGCVLYVAIRQIDRPQPSWSDPGGNDFLVQQLYDGVARADLGGCRDVAAVDLLRCPSAAKRSLQSFSGPSSVLVRNAGPGGTP